MGNPDTCNDGPQELCVAEEGRGTCVFGGATVLDGADVFFGRPCVQVWLGGSLPTVHREQLNTAYVGVHRRKAAGRSTRKQP